MSKKVLFLDCDGVLLDWASQYLKHIGSPLNVFHITEYNFNKMGLFPTDQEFFDSIAAFEKRLEWGQLPPMATQQHLEILHNAGFELHVLTQAGHGDPVVKTRRIWNLTRHFGSVFEGIHFTVRGQSKLDFMHDWEAKHGNVYGIVEDRGETLVEVAQDGIFKAIGIKYLYNHFEQLSPESIAGRIKWVPDMNTAAEYLVLSECSKP